MPDIHDIVIVGSGPAGFTAAVYAAPGQPPPRGDRGLGHAGGQLMLTTDVENFPGFPDGIMGPELMVKFREQAERFGAEFVTDDVDRVDFSEAPFGVWVGEREYRAKSIIIATGARRARMLGLPRRAAPARPRRVVLRHLRRLLLPRAAHRRGGRRRLRARGGDLPHPFASKVTLIHRRDELRASQDHAGPRARQPEDRVRAGTREVDRRRRRGRQVEPRRPARHRHRRRLRARRARASSSPSATTPSTELFEGQLDLDEDGYIVTGADSTRTNVRRRVRLPATSRTTSTARRSPPRARAAWRRSTPSAGSPRPSTRPPTPDPRDRANPGDPVGNTSRSGALVGRTGRYTRPTP